MLSSFSAAIATAMITNLKARGWGVLCRVCRWRLGGQEGCCAGQAAPPLLRSSASHPPPPRPILLHPVDAGLGDEPRQLAAPPTEPGTVHGSGQHALHPCRGCALLLTGCQVDMPAPAWHGACVQAAGRVARRPSPACLSLLPNFTRYLLLLRRGSPRRPALPPVPPEKPAESSSNGRSASASPAGAEGEEGEEPEDTQAKQRPKGRVHETESGEPE